MNGVTRELAHNTASLIALALNCGLNASAFDVKLLSPWNVTPSGTRVRVLIGLPGLMEVAASKYL